MREGLVMLFLQRFQSLLLGTTAPCAFLLKAQVFSNQRGIKPEKLAPAEDIKKVERRVAKDEKNMQKNTSKLPKK